VRPRHPSCAPIQRALSMLVLVVLLGAVLAVAVGPTRPAGAAQSPESAGDPAASRRSVDDLLATDAARAIYRAAAALVLPDARVQPAACVDAGTGDVPHLVAAIFRCHLRQAGWAEPDVARVAAEAVTVSHCESLWDPAAVVFDGRYLEARHPRTGYRYSAAGVFQFIRATADRWIDGGYANVTDARRNIDAAARLYLHNRASGLAGWDDWACAAANDGFKQGSVLPGWPGGPPALPDWALQY
jgi:hypothetical protein